MALVALIKILYPNLKTNIMVRILPSSAKKYMFTKNYGAFFDSGNLSLAVNYLLIYFFNETNIPPFTYWILARNSTIIGHYFFIR